MNITQIIVWREEGSREGERKKEKRERKRRERGGRRGEGRARGQERRKNESNSLTCEWEGGNYECWTRIYQYQTLSEFHKKL